MEDNIIRISMWSGPRNISTAMMYAFHHRGDCHVIDEPYYAHYLRHTGLQHPMRAEILTSDPSHSDEVTSQLCHGTYGHPILFMKNMPHHMVDIDLSFVKMFRNFFLIREPRAMIASYIKKRPTVEMSDLGLDDQYALYTDLVAAGMDVPVVESNDVLRDPPGVLSQLCERLDIPYSARMTSWPAGPIPGDGIWAKHWYASVHASSGFGAPRQHRFTTLPRHLEPLARRCEAIYDQMKKHT